jgi:hypothetical protein
LFQGQVEKAYPLFTRIRASAGERIADASKLDAVLAHCREILDVAAVRMRRGSTAKE